MIGILFWGRLFWVFKNFNIYGIERRLGIYEGEIFKDFVIVMLEIKRRKLIFRKRE